MQTRAGIGTLVVAIACLACNGASRAGDADADTNAPGRSSEAQAWLDGPKAAAFRRRVAELARLYGESGGIDPQGYRITARRNGADERGCAQVEIETSTNQGPVLRRDVIALCMH
jgi:hypothetical protein